MAFLLCPEQSIGQSFCLINHSGTRARMTKQSKALHNYFVCLLDVLMKNISFVLLEALSEIYSVGLRRWTQDVAVLTSMESPSHLLLPISLAQESLSKTFTSWSGCEDLLTSHELYLVPCLKLRFYRRHLCGD